jgi:hypothetical protein
MGEFVFKGARSMKYKVEQHVFDALPTLYIGVVAAQGTDNGRDYLQPAALWDRHVFRR